MNSRKTLVKVKEIINIPNLIENQLLSYKAFLQADIHKRKRKLIGIESVLRDVFTKNSDSKGCQFKYVSYRIERSSKSYIECISDGTTYTVSIYVSLQLLKKHFVKEEEIYIGEIPMITNHGSFIINGNERVVVCQLHKTPGISVLERFHEDETKSYSTCIIPEQGTRVEISLCHKDIIYVNLEVEKPNKRVLVTILLRAMGLSTNEDILNIFYKIYYIYISKARKINNLFVIEDVIAPESRNIIVRSLEPITENIINALIMSGIEKVKVVEASQDVGTLIIETLKNDATRNEEEALLSINNIYRPVEHQINAIILLEQLFSDPPRYNLGRAVRYKINKRIKVSIDLNINHLMIEDISKLTSYLCRVKQGPDVIEDNLGRRRLKPIGELLTSQLRLVVSKSKRLVTDNVNTIKALINTQNISTCLRDFFASSQHSQYMDQINPLSELSHKRRLSALGPGGISRDRANYLVRDVHNSYYGRICPIETPEGPNIGLINTLSIYAQINEFGFIETPYLIVDYGYVTNQIRYLTADEEDCYVIGQANAVVDQKTGRILENVSVRKGDSFSESDPLDVSFIEVCPKQLVSVAAGLIPFIEHNDANRALMGSNMQRQSVPLLMPESPIVGTGIEHTISVDCGMSIISEIDGVVTSSTGSHITLVEVLPNFLKENLEKCVKNYNLQKNLRTNASTCFNQKSIVLRGQLVKAGQTIACGASTEKGEIALGRNVLAAFMPWYGYNFEDAIIISEKFLKEDTFTSIHIEEFEVTARETNLGQEEITRTIPNLEEDRLSNLNPDGIIRVGAEVKPGDILVGKVSPLSERELGAEEKLLRVILGENTTPFTDVSVVVPLGIRGIVMDVKVYHSIDKKLSRRYRQHKIKKLTSVLNKKSKCLQEDLTNKLSKELLGIKLPINIINVGTGEIVIPAQKKITKKLLQLLVKGSKDVLINPLPLKKNITSIIDAYKQKLDDLSVEREKEINNIKIGIEEKIKYVKIYIATKRKIQVGDKIAGRHGNKGVVAKIVPEEDMPFLPDGTPIEMILNPMGVPSRMNVGQILETHLGWSCQKLGLKVSTPIFESVKEKRIQDLLEKAHLPRTGKTTLYDGRTGEKYGQDVVVGNIYMLKLNHLVEDKIHARTVGPYSLITQQPLGGRAQYGGQRFGEMEVWALEAYGASYTLQELITVKSDDIVGRTKIYEHLVKGDNSLKTGMPQSFNVLMKEIQSLCLDIRVY